MKKYLIFLFFSVSVFAQAQQTADEKEIQQLIQGSFDTLFSTFDSDQMSKFYTADFILLEDGEVWDNQILLDYFTEAKQNPNPATRVNRFEFIKTTVSGDRGWVAYHNFATISRDGEVIREVRWLESATAVKTDAGWRLDMLHSTRQESK
ncbi:nuclear transport factor 2 family protein [Algoriphagus terrigena]|uniref:nuclear transport factor 2 family protein n=1 Tax=Algoriphagus terrigena TaxID=344884 RepID=UPI000417B7C7|nr:nuclear transport factor 2 family protein [Algoriphagus terrigena]